MQTDRLDTPHGWLVTAGVMICLMIGPSTLLVACFGVMTNPLAEHFGWTRGQIGVAVTVMAVAITIASPLQGLLIDRFGARRVILLSILPFAALLAAMRALPASLWMFYAGWFALPFAAIGLWPAGYLKTVSGWFDRRLGTATGLANAGVGIGTIVGPPILAWVIARFGVMNGFLALAAAALIALPITALLITEHALPVKPLRGGAAPGQWSYRQMAASRHYRLLVATFFLLGFAGIGLLANLVPVLTSKGLAPGMAVAGLSAYGGMALFGRLTTGALLDRFHVSTVMWLLACTSIIALVVLVVGAPGNATIASVALLGLLSGGEFDVLAYALRRFFGLGSFGRMYGAAFAIFQLGGALGAAIMAFSVAMFGAYDGGLLLMALAAAGGAALLGRVGPYPARALEPGA